MKRIAWALPLLIFATPAHATWGAEDAALGKILWENIKQTTDIAEMLDSMRRATSYARETAGFARESVQVARNVKTILDRPGEFAMYALAGWQQSFPEVHESLANIYTMQELLEQAANSESLPDYDSYAYKRAFDALAQMNANHFETLAHAIDPMGVNDPHDEALKALKIQYEAAVGNLEDLAGVINSTGLSPVEASVYTARATTASAAAQVRATATLERIARTIELQFMNEERRRADEKDFTHEQNDAFSRMHLRTWQLDPLRSNFTGAQR